MGLTLKLIALFLLFLFILVFMKSIKIRILELGISMDDEFWHDAIEN